MQCNICLGKFDNPEQCELHNCYEMPQAIIDETTDLNIYSCEQCSSSCSSQNYLDKHILLKHSKKEDIETEIKCDQCQKIFTTKGNLTRHIKMDQCLPGSLASLEATIADLRKHIGILNAKVQALTEECQELENDKRLMSIKIEQFRVVLSKLRLENTQIQDFENQLALEHEKFEKIKQEKETLQMTINGYKDEFDSYIAANRQLQKYNRSPKYHHEPIMVPKYSQITLPTLSPEKIIEIVGDCQDMFDTDRKMFYHFYKFEHNASIRITDLNRNKVLVADNYYKWHLECLHDVFKPILDDFKMYYQIIYQYFMNLLKDCKIGLLDDIKSLQYTSDPRHKLLYHLCYIQHYDGKVAPSSTRSHKLAEYIHKHQQPYEIESYRPIKAENVYYIYGKYLKSEATLDQISLIEQLPESSVCYDSNRRIHATIQYNSTASPKSVNDINAINVLPLDIDKAARMKDHEHRQQLAIRAAEFQKGSISSNSMSILPEQSKSVNPTSSTPKPFVYVRKPNLVMSPEELEQFNKQRAEKEAKRANKHVMND